MTARTFEVTLISATARTVRHVVAHHAGRAVQIAVGMMKGEASEQFAIICKPTSKEPT